MSEFRDIVIGIDLGTTNTCAAYYIDGKVEVLVIEKKRVTPSVVAYTKKNEIIIGTSFKNFPSEPYVSQTKRLIGRSKSDPNVQSSLKYFPFKLDKNSDDPIILIEQENQTIRKTPAEIYTVILGKIKSVVEEKLEEEVTKAVITVPAYFNVTQRQDTLAAATAAGFTVLKLMNEPTAAALSYYHERKPKNDKYSLVFDFGGGTLDVAILKKRENDIEIIGVDGDSHLGGQDIDNLIIDFVCNKLETDYKFNCRENALKMRRLQNECEEAKKDLSSVDKAEMALHGFIKEKNDLVIELTRSQLAKLTVALFERSLHVVSNCLVNCNLKKNDIGDIILSGGTTRIPKLQQMLSEFFNNRPLEKLQNLDECVAAGAALQAAMFSTNPRQKIQNIRIIDVVSLSLGTDSLADVMNFIIKRNTPLPASNSLTFCTLENQQTYTKFKIYEGERLNAKQNRLLGEFTIDNLTPAPPGECKIILTMNIDTNGILKVEAKEKLKDNTKELTVTYTRGCRNDGEVKNILKDAEYHKEEDKKFMKFAVYKIYLIKYCNAVIYNLETGNLITTNEKIYDLCKSIAAKAAFMQSEQIETLQKFIEEIQKKCQPLIEKYKFNLIPSLEVQALKLNVTLP